MNFIINTDKKTSFHKHPIGRSGQYLMELMEPLKIAFGIQSFSYGKVYAAGETSILTTKPRYSEDFYNNEFYKFCFLDDPKNYKSGYYLSDCFRPNESGMLLKERYHQAHFFLIIRQNETYCERFIFGADDDDFSINNTYLNQRHVFDAFADYFKEKAANLIQEVDRCRVICPAGDCRETLLTPSLDVPELLDFLKPNVLLTSKEKECAHYLAQCLSLKEVSAKMAISPRTLEKHIAHLKAKLGCHNLTSLVVKLRGFHKVE